MKKISNLLFGALAGLILGIPCAFIQADRIKIGGQVIPYGAVLALALIVVAQLWLARSSQSKLSAIGVAIGWVLSIMLLGQKFETFEPIISAAWWSKIYVIGGAIVIGCASTLPAMRPIQVPVELPVPFTEGMKMQESEDQEASQE
jgi:hypothetical protein